MILLFLFTSRPQQIQGFEAQREASTTPPTRSPSPEPEPNLTSAMRHLISFRVIWKRHLKKNRKNHYKSLILNPLFRNERRRSSKLRENLRRPPPEGCRIQMLRRTMVGKMNKGVNGKTVKPRVFALLGHCLVFLYGFVGILFFCLCWWFVTFMVLQLYNDFVMFLCCLLILVILFFLFLLRTFFEDRVCAILRGHLKQSISCAIRILTILTPPEATSFRKEESGSRSLDVFDSN